MKTYKFIRVEEKVKKKLEIIKAKEGYKTLSEVIESRIK